MFERRAVEFTLKLDFSLKLDSSELEVEKDPEAWVTSQGYRGLVRGGWADGNTLALTNCFAKFRL